MGAGVMVMYGLEPFSMTQNPMDVPPAVLEMGFALWLLITGFDTAALAPEAEREPVPAEVLA